MPVFTGVGVALVTLFDDSGALDAPATAALAADLVDAGVQGVVVAGTTGEAATLDPDERIALLTAVRAAVPSATPVIAGTGAPSARQAVRLTRDALEHGADAVLVLAPPAASDVRPYYEAVADVAGGAGRVLAYHFPAVSPPGIPVSVLRDLPVAGCKDSSGDAGRLLEEVTSFAGALVHRFGGTVVVCRAARVRRGDPLAREPRSRALRPRLLGRRRRPARAGRRERSVTGAVPGRVEGTGRRAVLDVDGSARVRMRPVGRSTPHR